MVNPPTTSFSGTNLTSCKAPLTASFTNTSTGASSWLWDFGDGTTSNLQNPPPHTYIAAGNYQVTLTTSSAGGCSSSLSKPGFVVVQPPTITLNNFPAFGCAPYIFSPTATVSSVDGVASYSWNLGNGNTSTLATPPPQTYAAGTYTVTLTVITTGGCSTTTSGQVQVGTSKPTPLAFSFVPATACVASSVLFTATSGTANKWLWDFGDGSTATTQNPTYSYLQPGTFNVKLLSLIHI